MTSLQERLFAMQDKQYAAFQAKLTPGVPMESFIGIRVHTAYPAWRTVFLEVMSYVLGLC